MKDSLTASGDVRIETALRDTTQRWFTVLLHSKRSQLISRLVAFPHWQFAYTLINMYSALYSLYEQTDGVYFETIRRN